MATYVELPRRAPLFQLLYEFEPRAVEIEAARRLREEGLMRYDLNTVWGDIDITV